MAEIALTVLLCLAAISVIGMGCVLWYVFDHYRDGLPLD